MQKYALIVLRTDVLQGTPVYFVPEYTHYVVPSQLSHKGCDASNIDDEEIPEEASSPPSLLPPHPPLPSNGCYTRAFPVLQEQEFSNDEQEASARRSALGGKGWGTG